MNKWMKIVSNPSWKFITYGILISAAFTAIIAATASNLASFEIVGKTVPFAYPWRLASPGALARLSAWSGYLLHNLAVWAIIYFARRSRPKFAGELRWFNLALILINISGAILHIIQSQLYYDALAADVPEITALGSVAIMLMIVIIFETPRRGLIFGKKFNFKDGFIEIARKYHGYFFSWAIIYTFWYHPTEGTWGHLLGFFYMFMLFAQSALIYNRAHINRYWTFFLEFFVLIHSVVVAIFQGKEMWPMFAFGFGSMLIFTQMYGLGLNTLWRKILAIAYLSTTVIFYSLSGRISSIHEILRIPLLEYAVIILLYGVYLGITGLLIPFKSKSQRAQ